MRFASDALSLFFFVFHVSLISLLNQFSAGRKCIVFLFHRQIQLLYPLLGSRQTEARLPKQRTVFSLSQKQRDTHRDSA